MLLPSVLLALVLTIAQSPSVRARSPSSSARFQLECSNNPPGPLRPLAHHTTCSPLVDDGSALKIGQWRSPWSYRPKCARSKHARSRSNKLCAYTVTSLRSGPGMSIITTPDVAAQITGILQDPDIAWLEKERGFPLDETVTGPLRPFEARELPGRGIGVVATQRIQKDQVLLVELPLLMQIADWDAWGFQALGGLLQDASTKLLKREQDRLLTMARRGKGYVVDDIVRTNSFQVAIGGVDHSAVYPDIARINHACKPNCIIRHSPTTLAMEVVAYTNIAPGDELTLSYLPLNIVSERRQEMLDDWGFQCTCPLCSDVEASRVSDGHRNKISEILRSLRSNPENRTREAVQAAMAEVETIVEVEGLGAQIGDLYGIVADICVGMKDFHLAKVFAKLAVKSQRHYAGVDNDRSNKAVGLMKRLEKLERDPKA